MVPAVFLDKDGTLIPDIPYNVEPSKITLADFAQVALGKLSDRGFKLIVISNQSGVARGYFPESALIDVERRLQGLLSPVRLDGFYYCPHHPQGKVSDYRIECDCRKPKAGMLLKAAREHEIDLARSWMIGDILNDVEAGRTAGCRSILIDNGNETEWILNAAREPHFRVANLAEAAEIILEQI
ncbi:D-glycero-alpha-D-manno-heptose-1,7-bisphosphate 7-phosphatase [Leptolyngbya sp. NIES-2104]|uniref:D-glycero-alpha-D-manno-heptose-1,7-bisphosphate 7-phosphatase n=1 Tax=Leptolyngbya sp. NIES-2104 TaxID=1552121 RepID=UPI0006EC860B|nr:HAD family hydrolase [Leptolyngbya sp. NIES-2104]GAP94741.1 D-glycero-D-manno-heptose 1,7-bisphosphate phosphatase [Leptolyngbya sp. NIES-2104]